MKKILVPFRPMFLGTLGLAGAVAVGMVAATGSLSSAADPAVPGTDQAVVKREDQVAELVLVSDDDDYDSSDDTASGVSKTTVGTGSSRSRADGTNSRYTAVSRDRDLSRGDKTKDRTYDGPGGLTRDLTPNLTNDKSRNDTRR
jgi:hypothetical protein